MRITEILFWNNEPVEANDYESQLDQAPARFSEDVTNLATAFTRHGLVKHFWNLNGSEAQPSGPAPPDTETDLIPNSTLEPRPGRPSLSKLSLPLNRRRFAGSVREFLQKRSRPSSWWKFGTASEVHKAAAPVEILSAVVQRRAAIDGMADCAAATVLLSNPAPSAHRCAAAGLDSSTAAERLASMPSTAQWIA